MAGFCTTCGTARPDGARFCATCGAAFTDAAAVTPAPSAPSATGKVDLSKPQPVPPPVADAGFAIFPELEGEPVTTTPASSAAVDPLAGYTPPPITPPFTPAPSPPTSPAASAPSYDPYAPPPSANRTPLLIGGFALAVLAIGGFAWWAFSDLEVNGIKPKQDEAASAAPVAAAPAVVPEAAYVDSYLSPADEAMVTRGPVALQPAPGVSAAPSLRPLPQGAPITGRWVRGTDGTSRWFRVNGGGYLPEAAVAAATAIPPVRARPFDMDSAFVNALMPYLQQASTAHRQAMELAEKKGGDEVAASGYAAVPNRSMHGLTVSGAGSHWEGSSIIFRENATATRAAFRAAGWQVSSDGTVTVGPDDPVTCSIQSTAQWPDAARYGASELSCGL